MITNPALVDSAITHIDSLPAEQQNHLVSRQFLRVMLMTLKAHMDNQTAQEQDIAKFIALMTKQAAFRDIADIIRRIDPDDFAGCEPDEVLDQLASMVEEGADSGDEALAAEGGASCQKH